MHFELYALLGIPLVVIALLNLNIMVCDEEIRDFINRKIRRMRWINTFILLSFLFSYITGMIRLESQDKWVQELQIVSTLVISGSLFILEIAILKGFIGSGYKPGLSRDFLNYFFYITVLWLTFDRLNIPWEVVAVISTILVACVIYFGVTLWRYERISSMIVDYLDLYFPALGLRFFSTIVGLILVSYGHSEGVFKGLIALGSLVFSGTLWYSAFQMEKLLTQGSNEYT